jgi:hypothetical protein
MAQGISRQEFRDFSTAWARANFVARSPQREQRRDDFSESTPVVFSRVHLCSTWFGWMPVETLPVDGKTFQQPKRRVPASA